MTLNGTSLSSPIVAGIASLLKGYNNNLYNDDIEQLIKISADDKGTPGRDDLYGYGRVNAANALNYLKPPSQLQHFTATGGTAYSSSSMYLIILGGRKTLDGYYHVLRTEVRKTITLPNNYCSITGVWGTGLKTTGWHDNQGYCYGDGFCEVVPGSLTSTQVTLRTYVYQIYNLLGGLGDYRPQAPQTVTFAYSVLGIPGPTTISGDASFCTTSNSYTIPNLPVGATVTWQATPAGIATPNTPNSTQTTLTKNANGLITLTATISNACGGAIAITKSNIEVGTATPSIVIHGIAPYPNTEMDVEVVTNEPTPYYWYVDNTLVNTAYQKLVTINGGGCGFHTLKVVVSNTCGTASATTTYSRACSAIIASPNPTTGDVIVALTEPTTQPSTETKTSVTSNATQRMIYQIIVTDQLGNNKKQYKYSSGISNAKVSLNGLISGMYTIQAFDGTNWNSVKVIKE